MLKLAECLVLMFLVSAGAVHGAEAQNQHKIAIIRHQAFLPFEQACQGFRESLAASGNDEKIAIVEE